MGLSTMSIRYTGDTVEARIIVRKASVRAGLERSQLADEGLRFPDTDPLIHAARWLQYPAIRAGTVSGRIAIWEPKEDPDSFTGFAPVDKKSKPSQIIDAKTIEFETWLNELPEDLIMQWLEAVFAVNEHWVLASVPNPDTEEGKGTRRSE